MKKKTKSAKKAGEPIASRPFVPGYGLAAPKEGLLPWSWTVKKMESPENYWLATVRPEGRPHVMPVWGVWVDDGFYFSTGRKSRKGKNLAANASCCVCNDRSDEAVIVEGRAEQVKDKAELKKMVAAYKTKYKMDPTEMGEPIFAVRPSVVFAMVEKTFPKTATRWRW